MARIAGTSKIETAMLDWSEDDRQDAIDFACHPGNGTTAISLYLKQRGITASLDTVFRWQKSLIKQSERIKRIREVANDFKGLHPNEVLSLTAGSISEALVSFLESLENAKDTELYRQNIHKDIQAITALSKEARSSAIAMQTPHSSASAKELELGYVMSAFDKLEAIFIDDEIVLERIRLACKGILTEIEGSYQG
jgi:hypothetical protein